MLKVINGGVETLVEDWPGRLGYLGKGMASSGAFDNVALQFANLLVGNVPGEAGLEITGGYFEAEFVDNGVISLTGTDMKPTINDQPVPMWEAMAVNQGDKIKFGHFGEFGFRTYMGIAGGIVIPEYTREWRLRATPGPNAAPDYVTKEGMDFLFEHSFKVQHTSNRSAYRLDEVPDYFFAREGWKPEKSRKPYAGPCGPRGGN